MNATLAALIGGKGGECYSHGRLIGRVIGRDRKYGIGKAAYWAAYNNMGEWIGSRADYDEAVALVFGEAARLAAIPPCPYNY